MANLISFNKNTKKKLEESYKEIIVRTMKKKVKATKKRK